MFAEPQGKLARCSVTTSVAFFLLALTSGCGGGGAGDATVDSGAPAPATSASTEVRSACEVLPASVVQEVVGVPIRDSLAMSMSSDRDGTSASQCNYTVENSLAPMSLMVRKSAPSETGARASQSVREMLQESGVPVEEVNGLGDIAFFAANQLHVYLGNDWYLIIMPQPSAGLPQARALAERAIQRL